MYSWWQLRWHERERKLDPIQGRTEVMRLLCYTTFLAFFPLGCKWQSVQSNIALNILLHGIKLPSTILHANSASVGCLGSLPVVIPNHIFHLLLFHLLFLHGSKQRSGAMWVTVAQQSTYSFCVRYFYSLFLLLLRSSKAKYLRTMAFIFPPSPTCYTPPSQFEPLRSREEVVWHWLQS